MEECICGFPENLTTEQGYWKSSTIWHHRWWDADGQEWGYACERK